VREQPFECGTDGPRMIVVGADGSETSVHAVASALGMARRQRCRLTIVYAVTSSLFSGIAPEVAGELERTSDEYIAELRGEVRRAADEMGVPITLVCRRGEPGTVLRAVAAEVRADMVVGAASTPAGHRFVGSIGTRLVKLGRWPVVVVP
jgi:nucleotide-binding universal stress UspA family protein